MRFNFDATGLGSIPLTDPPTACRAIFENFPSIPYWPQLPKRSFRENMYVQFSEALPGIVLDERKKTIHMDTARSASEMEKVYARYLEEDLEFFKISEANAAGFYEFLDAAASRRGMRFVKGHITGPISFALFLTDERKRSLIYDAGLFEVLTKVLVMKAKWQIRKLKKVFADVIIFIDEPYLVSIGSSFVNIDMNETSKRLDEVVEAVKKEGALCGIHCCGNTDWPFLLKREIDILSFDAYNFVKELSLFAREMKGFLERNGTIAWGIVPSSEAADSETDETLAKRLQEDLRLFGEKGVGEKGFSSLVTPSCGTGSLDKARADRILKLTRAVAERFGGR